MNHNELLKELEKRMSRYGYCDTRTHVKMFIQEYEALTKDEKPIKLKDVIKRIKELNDGTRFDWEYKILQELGSDFGSKMFHEAYQQGRFDEAVETNHEPKKVVVPQFVADWYEKHKDDLEYDIWEYILRWGKQQKSEFYEWMNHANNKPFQTLINMHQFGYEVEKEPKYTVKFKATNQYLCDDDGIGLHISPNFRSNFRKSDLEKLSLTEVFDSPLFEVDEVE